MFSQGEHIGDPVSAIEGVSRIISRNHRCYRQIPVMGKAKSISMNFSQRSGDNSNRQTFLISYDDQVRLLCHDDSVYHVLADVS